jgi:hypothetical protein
MTFTLYYYNKCNKIAIKPFNLALNYAIKVIVGLRDIIRIIKSDFTNKRGFKNLI